MSNENYGITLPYDVILSHGFGCRDGIVSAWAVWRSLPENYRSLLAEHGGVYREYIKPDKNHEQTEYVRFKNPCTIKGALELQKTLPVVFAFEQPGTEIVHMELFKDKRVLILDLDTECNLVPIVTASKHTTVCDHHESSVATAKKYGHILNGELKDKYTSIINTDKSVSGAILAWDLINGDTSSSPSSKQNSGSKATNDLKSSEKSYKSDMLDVVKIADTWTWSSRTDINARAIITAMDAGSHTSTFPAIEKLYTEWDKKVSELEKEGELLLNYKNSLVKQMSKMCSIGYITVMVDDQPKIYTIAYAQATIFRSEVGECLRHVAEKKFNTTIDLCAAWSYNPEKDKVIYSLRSPGPGIDLSVLARNIKNRTAYGSGHPEASGCSHTGIENFHTFISKEIPNLDNETDSDTDSDIDTDTEDENLFNSGTSICNIV